MTRLTGILRDDRGSTLPLVIGYVVLALAVIIVTVDATSLYLAQKRVDAAADAAALAGADGFEIQADAGQARAVLTNDGVRAQADALVRDTPSDARLVEADTPDGFSARVVVAATWHPPIVSVFVPDGVELRATATARTGFR